ncbi:hypothetical protein ACTA71_007737 [Dictyostelium dimigraforme]
MELKILIVTIFFINIAIGSNPIFLENHVSLGKNQLQANYPEFDIPANYLTMFTLKIDNSVKNTDININIGSQKGQESSEDTILLQFNELNYVEGNTPFLVQLCTSENEETFNITCLNSDNTDCKLSISINASNTNNYCSQTLDAGTLDEFLKDFFNFGLPQQQGTGNEENGNEEQDQQQQQGQDQQQQQENGNEDKENGNQQNQDNNNNEDDGELRPLIKDQQQKQSKLKISRFNDATNNWFNNFFKNNI